MTYVCSDIHGFIDLYYEFLDTVHFSDNDTLYIIGDVLDRGSKGIKLIKDIMKRKNVILIKGNHEHMLLPTFEELYLYHDSPKKCYAIIQEQISLPIGQVDTLNDFCILSKQEKSDIIEYIKKLPLYLNITVNSRNYLLVHGGLTDFSEALDLKYYIHKELLFGPHDFSINHFKNVKIIVGHKPTCYIEGAEPYKIYKENDSIDIDCGLGFGGQLGVLCLDNEVEIYF